MITYKRAGTDGELEQILEIQSRAIKSNVSDEDRIKEGYITVPHTFDILKEMNDASPHILAIDGDTVAGYALVMLRRFRNKIPVLEPMFESADALLPMHNYLAMGQICIDKPYRSQGLFKGLYNFYREELSATYDCLFTEVATANTRSLEAHKAVGFKILKTEVTDGTSWELINWEWNA